MCLCIDNSIKVQADKAGYVECWKILYLDGEELRSPYYEDYTWQKGTWHEAGPHDVNDQAFLYQTIQSGALHVYLTERVAHHMLGFTGPPERTKNDLSIYKAVFHIRDLLGTGRPHPCGSEAAVRRLYLIEKVDD